MMSSFCEMTAAVGRQGCLGVLLLHRGGRKSMALPRRIFIALGDPSDVSPVAAHDVQLLKLREEATKREKVEKHAKELEKFIYERQKRNEQVLGAVTLSILVIATFSITIWLCRQPPPPERSAETPLVIPVPVPISVPQPLHDCKSGCGPHYNQQYEGFECWRHRSMRGLCFD
jgi:hypothetical protein